MNAQFTKDGSNKSEQMANARLISAAPDMYEALSGVKDALWLMIATMPDCPIKAECSEKYQNILAALSAAEGRE